MIDRSVHGVETKEHAYLNGPAVNICSPDSIHLILPALLWRKIETALAYDGIAFQSQAYLCVGGYVEPLNFDTLPVKSCWILSLYSSHE
jgi:hypothetical protein